MPIPPASLQATECQERPVECKFCEVAVRLSMLEIHEHHCGNRIELCPDCGQLIKLPVLAKHRDVCQSEQAQLRRGEQCRLRRKREASRKGSLSCVGCKECRCSTGQMTCV